MMYNNPGNVRTTAAAAANPPIIPYPDFHHPVTAFSGGAAADEFPARDERLHQWSYQETRDFIEIRAQVEWEFKGKKNLWEMVVNRMREKGYCRTIDQCKSKWKNLVNRYKAQETSDLDNVQQCPFFYELHAVFTARDNRLNQDSETAQIKGKKRLENAPGYESHEEYSEDEQENEDDNTVAPRKKGNRVKKQKKEKPDKQSDASVASSIQEMLRSFMKQQQLIDMQWKEVMEKHAQEREVFEQEWRQTMENLEKEKMMMERAWREREEQRRLREESRAERRDALLTMLLNRLVDEDNP